MTCKPDVDRWAELAEINENLIRSDLSPAQRAKLIAKRKAAYEDVHPETRNGAAGRGRTKVSQVGKANDSFTADTAAKSGRSRTAVARDATRARALGADLDRVTGTSLDTGRRTGRAREDDAGSDQLALELSLKRDRIWAKGGALDGGGAQDMRIVLIVLSIAFGAATAFAAITTTKQIIANNHMATPRDG